MEQTLSEQRSAAAEGAQNLLHNCVGLKSGESVLLVQESHGTGYFDDRVPLILADEAQAIGASVLTMSTPRAAGPDHVPQALSAAMEHVDHTIFMNRIGDQMRFKSLPGSGSKTMIYTLDQAIMGARSAQFPHQMMVELVRMFNAEIVRKKTWRITCPAGTDIGGDMPEYVATQGEAEGNFTVNLFPASVHKPVPAGNMNGRIVLDRFVTGTNTNVYSPEVHHLAAPVTAIVRDGHVVDLEGPDQAVEGLRAHSRMVAELFGLDETLIHSWHAGLNPGTTYTGLAADDPVRWNGMIFGSPRHLHFHTCGDYPPGEINWHIIDPTVSFDGQAMIENGHVSYFDTPEVAALLAEFDYTADQLHTEQEIGL